MSTSSSLADALIVVETAGTFAFALSGLIEAARKRLDGATVARALDEDDSTQLHAGIRPARR